MQYLWRDLLYGVRVLLRKPGFTAAALLSLVLGIGLNTAIFTLFDAIFLRPIPVDDLDRLAAIYATRRNNAGEASGYYSLSHPNYEDLQERSKAFSGIAAQLWHKVNLSGGSEPLRATGTFATTNYFEVLQLEPRIGRFFAATDTAEGSRVAVLSHGCWSRIFGGEESVLGAPIRFNGEPFTVIGVAPRGFKGTETGIDVDVWVPIETFEALSPYGQWFEARSGALFRVFGRLADGVSFVQAREELVRLIGQLEEEFPDDNEGMGARIKPLLEGSLQPTDRPRHLAYGKILFAAVGLILLMSCLNVAGLLLVRGLERGREIAVRQSLGASRRRMAVQLISENLFLFVLGGLLSLPVARLSLDLLWRFRPPQFAADALDLSVDATIFGMALLTALVSGLIFGLVPALSASRLDLVSHLKESSRGRGQALGWLQPRRILVAGQVALALIALIAAGLYARSLANAQRIDVGFEADSLLALSFAPGEQGYEREPTVALYRRVLERVEALPGVKSAALSENRLLRGAIVRQQVFLEGETEAFEGGGRAAHRTNAVFPGFFSTVGMPLIRGRDFDDTMTADSPRVAIINESMARFAWPGEDPIGKRFHLDYPDRPAVEVIGVARDAKYRHIHESEQSFLYFPEAQRPASAMTLHVRAEGDPKLLLTTLREQVHALAPELPLADVKTMRAFVDEALWIERVSASLLTAFGLLALLLATLGVYSVLAQAVSQQRREMGVRMAIGAQRSDVLRVVLAEGLKTVALGLVLGLLVVLVLGKLGTGLSSQLHGVEVVDPLLYVGAALMLLAVALLGFLVPAIKAMRVDPVRALRSE